ncbi:DNA-processing protein DprA [Vibrio parahaemolyticus]|uniref:DNA-processing protein DprA n=1 Tax=Vibrio parahaemolyticus TaxID=670 RepID=UPI001594E455|nr:DNA-processing protein DprA [Vibrio parahaemolyticus]EKA7363838.1 DNA-protecting protein DprA [Vibrio parahaemolyticus]NVC26302.1 DNA-processing protein DprA [Vibrio parahaemolyticus]
MNLSNNAKAILLLTSYFSKASKENVKPLSNSEWGRFALWLKENKLVPESLLKADAKQLLSSWRDPKITLERLLGLLDRGHSLALATDKWARAGIWVLTRSDSEYPWRLKSRLKTNSPPVLFGCGNKELLNAGGIAVVGSRNAPAQDLLFTEKLGAKAALSHVSIVSGASRGIDEAAMLGAMNSGGVVIGVLSEDLLRTATSLKWRQGIMNDKAVLVSPFYPEAGFSAGNAMGRNKYIYCLSDASLVVHSGKKGGTISGASENIRNQWVPLWVKPTLDKGAANEMLVDKGGYWCDPDIETLNVRSLIEAAVHSGGPSVTEQQDLFAMEPQEEGIHQTGLLSKLRPDNQLESKEAKGSEDDTLDTSPISNKDVIGLECIDFYDIFVAKFAKDASSPVTLDELIESTQLHKSQLNEWLKKAIEDGIAKKLNRPVRYQYISN